MSRKKNKLVPIVDEGSIDINNTDEIICPWCGYEYSKSNKITKGMNDMDDDLIDCPECENSFHLMVEVQRNYTTER